MRQYGRYEQKPKEQESSAKLTNQRVNYMQFTSSPFSFHARHILPLPSSSKLVLDLHIPEGCKAELT